MLNIISICGQTRSGKGAIGPIFGAALNSDLPHNTPDLDWYVDAYEEGAISKEALCRLCANYLLCYSWYSYLGRHINSRASDYYSMRRLKSGLNWEDRFNRGDNDNSFKEFCDAHRNHRVTNIFHWDIPASLHLDIEKQYPINLNPVYCCRSPFALFSAWAASDRYRRAHSLSRMFKFIGTKHLSRRDMWSQFTSARTEDEAFYDHGAQTYKYRELNLSDTRVTNDAQLRFVEALKTAQVSAGFYREYGLAVFFERVVEDPDRFAESIAERFNLAFDGSLLKKAILLADKRPLRETLETDLVKIERELTGLGCNDQIIALILDLQQDYLSRLFSAEQTS